METYIAYFDETGDDGLKNSPTELFVLTSVYVSCDKWQKNYDAIKNFRRELHSEYGFHVTQEMHTKKFIQNKNPYRQYGWNDNKRRDIVKRYATMIASLDISTINVVIDKTKIVRDDYRILENALTYNIQRIENDSGGDWYYILISDPGRIGIMRRTARKIRAYNPIESKYSFDKDNKPIKYMVEDLFEKDSKESYFVQISDFISYFVYLYYRSVVLGKPLKDRISKVINEEEVKSLMDYFAKQEVFNIKANQDNKYGLVIYPK